MSVRRASLPDDVAKDDLAIPFYRIQPDGSYSYEAWERGGLLFRRETRDIDELLYWIADSVVNELAVQAALDDPRYVSTRDSRTLWFPLWSKWMSALHPDWGRAVDEQIAEILSRHPFR